MEPVLDKATIVRPSYIASIELPPRTGPVNVEDLKADLSDEFSLVSSNLDISQRNSLDSKEHIQVCLRIRPFTASEKENESQDCVSIQDLTSITLKGPKNSMICRLSEKNIGQIVQKFTFSRVFGPETTQEEFFNRTVKQPVQDFLEGYNRLIFTYGVTNAGKTYTFQGTEADIGILPRTMDMLFKSIHGKLYPDMDFKPLRCRDYIRLTKEQVREEIAVKNSMLRLMKEIDSQNNINNHSKTSESSEDLEEPVKEPEQPNMSVESCVKFSVWVSFCEIYNECIYDLLLPVSNDKKRKVLRLAQDIKGCSYVKDLQWIQVSDSKEAFKLLKLGLKHQSIACTKLNTFSSRSHSIFTVKMLKIEDSEAPNVTRVNELALCDLAGSERCTKTRNEGDRLKESGNINTSLLILGKCINALKNSQQSKLQLHIPFRESKLTHFLQGFFSGKGKVYMIVNISQCAAAYDETLNVLKFSAIAQKICVLDTSTAPQEQPVVQKSAREVSFLNNADTKMQVARKRATILWDRSLEDVIEDEDDDDDDGLTVDNNETHEHDMAKEMSNEEEEEEYNMANEMPNEEEYDTAKKMPNDEEENKVIIGKEEYERLLNIIEHLKSKLVNERKDKLLLELKIREEVTQEFTQYFAQRETDFRQCLSHERELLEKASEQRLEIYKDLVNECAKNPDEEQEMKNSHCNERAEMLEGGKVAPENCIDLEGIINILQDDVTDIKKQAEEAHRYIVSLEDPQEAIAWLEQKLGKVTVELTKTKEELAQRTKELEMQVIKLSEGAQQLEEATEKMTSQNKRIQELMHIVEQKDNVISRLQDLISHLETTVKDYDNTVTTIKRQMAKENSNGKIEDTQPSERMKHVLDVGRKRCIESKPTQEEEPPTKKGSIRSTCKGDAIEQKKMEEMQQNILEKEAEILALQERSESQDCQLVVLKEQLTNEKREKEGFSRQMANLSLELSSSKERASGLSEELQHCKASYGKIASELDTQKAINKEQEEKIKQLTKEVEASNQNTRVKVSQIKAMRTKIDELHKLDLESCNVDVDLITLKDFLEDSQKEKTGKIQMHSLNIQCQTSNIADVRRESSFHFSIEGIWKECKQIIKASSQKSNQIQELLQQVENLQKSINEVESENNQLKIQLDDITNQGNLSIKAKENLVNQLQEQLQKKISESEQHVAEDRRVVTQFERESASHKEKIKELECLLEAYRVKDDSAARLEQILQEKESIILKMERDVKDLEKKCLNSEIKVQELNDQETKLKEDVIQLKNNLKTIEHSLQEKEREEEESKKVTEQLNKELSESSAFIQRLKMDCQRKDEAYTDLKEKLADAKKQIEQVQKEVCTMRSEEKLLRSKVNEYEKTKKQLAEELDMKQRTIQQLKKELLGNEQIEEISKQYQNACKDLCEKEKIIEDMRLTLEEQEQTQLEQDQVLEAKLEEIERLISELEEWKQKYKELEKRNSELQQKINKHEDKNKDAVCGELISLKERLEEIEEKCRTDRKKWVEEKMGLITQVKEAENHRNRDMRKFAEDRERHVKQQTEVEKLTAQLAEKDNDLQKWRKERDQLVAALEVQLSTLVSSNIQKDKEIEELKRTTLMGSGKDYGTAIEELKRQMAEKDDTIKKLKQHSCHTNSRTLRVAEGGQNKVNEYLHSKQFKEKQRENNPIAGQSIPISCNEVKDNLLSQCPSSVSSLDETEDHSDIVLDSSEVSTENGKGSRFPKPEMEIQFTPLHPNKMEVKHQGSALPVTVKMPKTRRKRKSNELDEDFIKSENKKNATPTADVSSPIKSSSAKINKKKMVATTQSFRKEYPLRKHVSTSSTKSTQKKDGTLQKLGDFFQSSPIIIHSKAKKLIATISSPKSTEVETHKAKELKPKRTKRKLYSTDISSPLDFPGDVIMDQKEKESDHLIIKRRLRSKTGR